MNRIIKQIPNTITSMNLLCGVLGVIFTLYGRIDIAFYLMLGGAVCDFCDGLVARLLGAYSELGKQLDSLADMVTFGVLPSMMMFKLMLQAGVEPAWICYIPLIISVFSALRLAKFNIDERQSENFIGLATPACAMICGSFAYYVCETPGSLLNAWTGSLWFIPAAAIILSLLLISEIPMFSMKFKKGAKGEGLIRTLRLTFFASIAVLAIVVLALGLNWSLIILLTFLAYILLNLAALPFSKR